MNKIELPFVIRTSLPVRIVFGAFLFGSGGVLGWEFFQKNQMHSILDSLYFACIELFLIGVFAYQLSVVIVCDEDGFVLKRFFIKVSKVKWNEIKKVRMKAEGRGYVALKIYYEKALWGWPISLGAKTFPFDDLAIFRELLDQKAHIHKDN